MNPDRHMTELSLPPDSAVHQALALLRDERNAARREAAHYRGALESIQATTDPKNWGRDPRLSETLIHAFTHRTLLWKGKQRRRTLRDRLAGEWTKGRIPLGRVWDEKP